MIIDSFFGKYRFLSNFYPCFVRDDMGLSYVSVEHAYQANKSLDIKERIQFVSTAKGCISASEAKQLGKTVKMRPDFNHIKVGIMEEFVRQKFRDPKLRLKLLETKSAELIEGNTWGDTFWGVCDGKGQNHLGKILMKVRDEIKKEYQLQDIFEVNND